MLEHEAKQDWVIGGKSTGQKRAQLQLMGKENDFIISRQSKSLQRFKSMEDYERYLEKQESIQSGEHLEKMTEHYKENYKKALDNAFNDEAQDIKDKLDSMSGAEFRALVEKDELAEIGYIYDPEQAEGRLADIRNAFGVKGKKRKK
jgi:hypothetical protein